MNISHSGSQPSRKGPADWFTGDVRIDAPFQATEPAKVGGATVTFEPGARTAWHTHPLGQTLIVVQDAAGCRSGQRAAGAESGRYRVDPAGVKHWHGASSTTAMVHIAIAEAENGSPVTWQEHVSDEQYQGC
ncbi:Uncharacterised protein [Raoultella terrigena]|uniref:Cupin domain n=1 Tax=Raoultella terrigena TaxID=577 RepID=A0A3P8IZH8_RAOTE|nr:Uncharacterised protein [Raoultella terrigena]